MEKWVLYARTSTNKQEKGLEAQIRALKKYCMERGIEDYDLFFDEGVSGAKSSRPHLDQMMVKIDSGNYRGLIVYSFSRFARSTKHLLETLENLSRKGIFFISTSENIDTSSAIGKALFTIISAISQLERELISERVKNGLANAKAKGKRLGRVKTRSSELIHELHKKGYSQREIGRLAGCSKTTVYRELKSGPKR